MKNESNRPSPHEIWLSLGKKEKIFIQYACTEMTYKEIAAKMDSTVKAVDGYRDNVFNRFNVKSRIGMVSYALKHHIVSLPPLK